MIEDTKAKRKRVIPNRTGLQYDIGKFIDEQVVYHPLSSLLLKDLYDAYITTTNSSSPRMAFQIIFEELLAEKANNNPDFCFDKAKSAKGIVFKGIGLKKSFNSCDDTHGFLLDGFTLEELKAKVADLEKRKKSL